MSIMKDVEEGNELARRSGLWAWVPSPAPSEPFYGVDRTPSSPACPPVRMSWHLRLRRWIAYAVLRLPVE